MADGIGAGRLAILGVGPGDIEHMTVRGRRVIQEAELVIGYRTYLELIEPLLAGKETFTTGMRREKERVERALLAAGEGRRVCLVSGGDPGVYGLAGLVFEMAARRYGGTGAPAIEVIPGVTAATAAAAILGAPLMHDFAVISLSDLLTKESLIESRIEHAARGDFVIVLYNPRSKTRTRPFDRACRILLEGRPPTTAVAVVSAAYRAGQRRWTGILADLPARAEEIGMSSVVIVGNSHTFLEGDRMITPRGYEL